MPLWKSETFKSGFDGGWSCPIVADGNVYLFSHYRNQIEGTKIPKREFPYLSPDKRGHLTPAEYQDYEVNRRNEDEAASEFYEYTERIFAFDADSGETKWTNEKKSTFTRFLQSSTPTYENHRLYVIGAPRTVRCIDTRTSKSLWETRLPGDFRDEFFMSSPSINGDVLAVFANELYGLDKNTGEILWTKTEYKNTHSSASAFKNCFIVNAGDNQTRCIDAKTGDERWAVQTYAKLSTPIIRDNLLITYGASRKGGVRAYQISPEAGKELWVNTESADQGCSPVLAGDHLYVMGERQLSCINLKTGERTWKEMLQVAKPRYTSIVAMDNKLFYPWEGLLAFHADPTAFSPIFVGKMDQAGLLDSREAHWKRLGFDEAPDPAKAREQFRKKVESQGPVNCTNAAISDGRIFLRRKDHVICYDLRK